MRRAELVAVTTLFTLMVASSAVAVRSPTDHDVADYLAFVAYMGPTAHACWTYENGVRPNMYPGVIFGRLRKDASIYHGTVDGSWADNFKIRTNSFYSTSKWYPTLHILGKSYFTGGILLKNYKKEPQALTDPKILEYKMANTQDLYLYAYDFFPEKFVGKWIKAEENLKTKNDIENYYKDEKNKPGMKPNIAAVNTISKYWNLQFNIPIQGFIQRRAIQGADFNNLAKGVVGRTKERESGDLSEIDGKTYFVNKLEQFSTLFQNTQILQYDEVVYFGSPEYKESTSVDNPKDHPDAIAKHVGSWLLKACDHATDHTTVFPYTLDYMTYWPWNNNPQSFGKREQTLAIQDLQKLDVRSLRGWNKELREKLYKDLIGPKKKNLKELDLFYALAARSSNLPDSMTSAQVAQIRALAYDLLVKYCDQKDVNNYFVCKVAEIKNKSLNVNGALKKAHLKDNSELNPWLY
ncbi:MAG: hypothetical protein QNK24_16485 [Desulfuromusa sp.]|nr:hypothetical protein [Desulfuromusa sp.]